MPRREDIKKIMVIGSGPIIIGQACEFDYSGTQACKALKEEGYEVVLVNSNPATIMTDPTMADRTYIEPLTADNMEKIIVRERPDALLPNLGGQTGLNLSSELSKRGVLDKYGVEMIGVMESTIRKGEDRITFKETMAAINIPVPKSAPAHSLEEAEKIADDLGYPVVLRPAYTMGGTGGGIAYNIEELRTIVARGLSASMVGQVLVEESVLGWEEHELEVVRDGKGKKITICFIENVDPIGVHTGDSFCVAPQLTASEELKNRLEEMSYRIVEEVGVLGGCNVQFAYDPETERIVIIEINPRTSRSSALASKATGFPIAMISAKLAVGITLEEIPHWKEGTLDRYKPSADYVVAKFPRWAFEKLPKVEDKLGTQMRAVGEAMSIGKNFKEAFQKAISSLEIKRYGLGEISEFQEATLQEIKSRLVNPSSERFFLVYEALRKGMTVEELYEVTKINRWFLGEMKDLADLESEIKKCAGKEMPAELLVKAKEMGFSDKYIALLTGKKESAVRRSRLAAGKNAAFSKVMVSGADAAYYYSSYNVEDQVEVFDSKKVMILGGGPNRIGQGIEFDYTCVHAAFALKEEGVDSVMVNCNPETVSTDYDTSSKLYFEPLTVENVLSIYEKEKPYGVIVQFGGQTPLNIAKELVEAGVNMLGTSWESIHLSEDREQFSAIIEKLNIPQPESGIARSVEEAVGEAERIGYPLIVRPSFVLGGRGMQIVYDKKMLLEYIRTAIDVSPEHPMLIDRFLEHATEVEVDAVADGEDVYIPAVMEHIEQAGVHSGDSACVIPAKNISERELRTIEEYTTKITKALNVVGLLNIQYAIADGKVYILEANPRASRTVPVVSKVMNINMAKAATQVLLGKKLKDILSFDKVRPGYVGVKEAVFPFNMFPEVDPLLGPEMRATGEVMGLAEGVGLAFYKAQAAVGARLPFEGTVLISVSDKEKGDILKAAQGFAKLGFEIMTTKGTGEYLSSHGIASLPAVKLHEGRPNIADDIHNGKINMIINTPVGSESKHDDSYIRKAAIQHKIPYITTAAAALAAARGIEEARGGKLEVKSLQEYHASLRS